MKLTRKVIKNTKNLKTPFLVIDPEIIRQNYKRLKKSIKNVEVFYAMKANDHPKILETLKKEGSSFEISSLNEMKSLLSLGVKPSRIMCFNSIKNEEFLKEMERVGIKIMAFDSTDEVDKIAKFAPSAQLVLRLSVSNEGSDWPLTKKYGVDPAEAIYLIEYAHKKGLTPIGLTFHVGSQCLNKNNWGNALYACEEIWKQAQEKGIHFNFISLGGGMPVKHLKEIPKIEEIGYIISKILKKNFKTEKGNLRVTIEPGRGLIGDAAIMGTTVVGKAKRGSEDWIYIDVGVFNGLMETVENFQYELKTEKGRRKKHVTIAGPSCDSVDIPFKKVLLTEVEIDDRIYIINTGAYTTVYAAPFNGFNVPSVHFIGK